MGPHAGIEVGQKFQTHAELVSFSLWQLGHLLVHFGQCAGKVFHMMSHLVGDDVGIGKVAIGTQLFLHGSEEREVDIQFLVARAVEGPHLCRALPAGGLRGIGIEHHRRYLVLGAILLEDLRPHVFCTGQNLRRELGQFLFFLGEFALTLGHLGVSAHRLLGSLHAGFQRVTTREVGNSHSDDDTTDTQTSFFAATHTTAVFHIGTLTSSV